MNGYQFFGHPKDNFLYVLMIAFLKVTEFDLLEQLFSQLLAMFVCMKKELLLDIIADLVSKLIPRAF